MEDSNKFLGDQFLLGAEGSQLRQWAKGDLKCQESHLGLQRRGRGSEGMEPCLLVSRAGGRGNHPAPLQMRGLQGQGGNPEESLFVLSVGRGSQLLYPAHPQ